MRRPRSSEAGFSLIEVIVTVVIVGVSFAIFVGGMGVAVMGSEHHRKIAGGQASIRNFAEAMKAAPYVDCATAASYQNSYSPTPPERLSGAATFTNATAHVAPNLVPEQPGKVLLAFFALAKGSSFSTPAGMGPGWNLASSATLPADQATAGFFDAALNGTAATGTHTANSGIAGDSVAQAVVLPAATGATPVRHGVFSDRTPSAGAASLTLSKPPNTAAGDAMFAQVAVRGGTAATVTAPVGWIVVSAKDSGTGVKSVVYERTATSSDANTYTWSFDGVRQAVGGVASYAGISLGYSATVTAVKYWNGTSFVTTCPSADAGLQQVSLHVQSLDSQSSESVDVIKRKP